MFSSRFNYELSENPLNRLLIEKKSRGEKIIDLTISNPTLAGFDYNTETILKAISQPESLKYAPELKGLIRARNSICEYYSELGYDLNPDSFFLTSGTSEAYSYLFKLLTDPGDEILIPRPSYPLIDFIASLENIVTIKYPLRLERNRMIDFKKLKECITGKTKALIIINPNNPAGSYVKNEEIEILNDICTKKQIAIISDEVFYDFKIQENINSVSLAGNKKVLTFILSGLSKICALPQMKLSWILVNAPKELHMQITERMEIITDTFLTVGTPVQHSVEILIQERKKIQKQIIDRIYNNLKILEKGAGDKKKVSILKPEGGWYSIIKFSDDIPDDVRSIELLRDYNIYIHPGYFFDFEKDGYFVLSMITPENSFREGIDRIFQVY